MKQRSRTEYSLINIFVNLGGYLANTIFGFLCRIVFVRCLSADYLGVSGLFTNILSMLSLAELGIGSAIGYALYKPIAEDDKEKIISLMQFYGKAYKLIGIFVAIVGIAMLPFLNVIITNPPNIKENIYFIYILYLFNVVFSYFFSYKSTLFSAAQRNYIVTGYNYVITIAQSVVQIIYLLITHEYIGYLLIQIIGGVLYNIWISYKANKDYPYIKTKKVTPLTKTETKSLLINIKALTVNKLSGVLVNNTDNIAITYFDGLKSVGFASNYVLFSTTLDALITRTFNALTGSVGNLNASKDKEGQYVFFKILNLANFWLYGWAAIGIMFISSDLVRLFYGENYVMQFRIPLILAINFYTIGMLHASYTYKSTLGLFKYGQYILIFTGIINLILDIILGKIFGVFGIYLATLIARICTNLWYEPYAVYRYGLQKNPLLYLIRYCYFAFILFITGLLCSFLCGLCHFTLGVNILIKCIICSIIPNFVFIVSFHKTKEFIYLKQSAKNIFKRVLNKI